MVKLAWKARKCVSIKRESVAQTNNITTREFIYRNNNAIFRNGSFPINGIEFFGRAKDTCILPFGCTKCEHNFSAMRHVFDTRFQKIN